MGFSLVAKEGLALQRQCASSSLPWLSCCKCCLEHRLSSRGPWTPPQTPQDGLSTVQSRSAEPESRVPSPGGFLTTCAGPSLFARFVIVPPLSGPLWSFLCGFYSVSGPFVSLTLPVSRVHVQLSCGWNNCHPCSLSAAPWLGKGGTLEM